MRTFYSIAAILVMALLSRSADAQDAAAPDLETKKRDSKEKQQRARFESRFKREHQRLSALLENLDRICRLSKEQKATLKDASRKALDEAMKAAGKRARYNARPGVERMVGPPAPPAPVALTRQPAWLKAIDQTLTDKQKRSYQKEQRRRRATRQDAAMAFALEMIDQHVFLTGAQRARARELIKETLAAKPAEIPDEWNAFMFSHAHLLPTLYGVPDEKLKTFLGQEQLKSWRVFMRTYSQRRIALPASSAPPQKPRQ